MKRVVADHFCGPYVGGTASDQHTQSWISAAEAARLIGVRAERVVDAVSAGQIEGKIDHSGFGHRHTMIPRCVVENIKAERMDVLDKTKTREALEISKNQYSLLEEAGVLKETKPKAHGALIDGEHSQHALEKLIKRIASKACVFEGETVEIQEISLRFTTDKTGLIAFYETVVSGKLSPTTGSTSGKFSEFAFSKEKVHHFLNQRRRSGGWTVQELAQITGWKEQCIAHWCDAGLIKHKLRSHSRGVARAIYPKALAEFQTKYVRDYSDTLAPINWRRFSIFINSL